MKFLAVITSVRSGDISKGKNIGQQWQQLELEGIRVFVPDELQNGYCVGQRVKAEVLYRGMKRNIDSNTGAVTGYEPDYQLLLIEVVPDIPL